MGSLGRKYTVISKAPEVTPGLSLCVGDECTQCFSLTGSRLFQLAAVHQCMDAMQQEPGIVMEEEL